MHKSEAQLGHYCPAQNIFHVIQVCLMSQLWDSVASMHDHLLTVHSS